MTKIKTEIRNFRSARKERRRSTVREKKLAPNEIVFISIMLVVPIIQFCVFWLSVNIRSVLMAFQLPSGEWSMNTFKQVFLDFRTNTGVSLGISIRNSIIFWLQGVLMIPFNLYITYFLYKKIRGYRLWQVMMYLPGMIGSLVVVTAFKKFIEPNGPVGTLLKLRGVNPVPEFLQNSDTAFITILLYSCWMGWASNLLLLGGALARIPVEILEAARIDGVGPMRELIYVIFPLVWPTVSTLLILGLTSIFSVGGNILLFTGGAYGTSTIGYWMFHKVYYAGPSAYNQVSAAGLIFTAIGVPVILGVRKIIEKIPTVEY